MNPYPGPPNNAEWLARQEDLGEEMERRREQIQSDAFEVLAYAGAELFAKDWNKEGEAWEILTEMMSEPEDWHRLLRAGMDSPEEFRRELRCLADRYAHDYISDERLIRLID